MRDEFFAGAVFAVNKNPRIRTRGLGDGAFDVYDFFGDADDVVEFELRRRFDFSVFGFFDLQHFGNAREHRFKRKRFFKKIDRAFFCGLHRLFNRTVPRNHNDRQHRIGFFNFFEDVDAVFFAEPHIEQYQRRSPPAQRL